MPNHSRDLGLVIAAMVCGVAVTTFVRVNEGSWLLALIVGAATTALIARTPVKASASTRPIRTKRALVGAGALPAGAVVTGVAFDYAPAVIAGIAAGAFWLLAYVLARHHHD